VPQGLARVAMINYYYVEVVALTKQGAVRLPEWFQTLRQDISIYRGA